MKQTFVTIKRIIAKPLRAPEEEVDVSLLAGIPLRAIISAKIAIHAKMKQMMNRARTHPR